MSTLQIRDVPDDVHRTLKARAALAGMSLSAYALDELSRIARRPTLEELDARIQARGATHVTTSAAEMIRTTRNTRP